MTTDEVTRILIENYTVEEICDLLDLSPADLCYSFSCKITRMYEEIVHQIKEDLGYDEDTED